MENNYQPENNYQAPNYQPDPNYQAPNGYQPDPNYQAPNGYQPDPNYQAPNGYQPEPNYQAPYQQPAQKPSAQAVQETAQKVAQQVSKTATGLWGKLMALPKTILIGAVAAVLVLAIGVPLLVGAFTNTYKTPLELTVSYMNNKKASTKIDGAVKLLNGLCESEAKTLLKIIKKADMYEEVEAEIIESFEDSIEDMEDDYGKNYKYDYKIDDKDKLEKEDLRDFRDQLKEMRDELDELVEETKDFDNDDWEDLADELGMSKADAKKLVAALEDVCKELKTIKVTAGYELTVIFTLDGSELDEPEENEMEIKVYKVNGRWVSMDALMPALGSVAYSLF